ncbi:Uma2 family endonuclease [Dyadobacter psychrotolerans]|uniref:Uma2 family endonuclease n=1 Tax=Dyadobacter psychrotolerans TaxID=2541721 RepID=A0A4R5DGF9_9BACT|nr:Uma2 family endonuclease [Dyadobacter psychrotolerans]TDE12889.1 Uma2 family endonuclease [Dyadobacter psychrotolerans]
MDLPLKIRSFAKFTDDMFFDLCQANSQLFLERDKDGNIIVMAPTGSDTGFYNSDINGQIWHWNRSNGAGYVFDSSAGFTLPNGAVRSPDVSWIARDKWEALSKTDQNKFAHICPDLVVEVMSSSDSISELKNKMEEYRSNGCRLGWLIDRAGKQVHIYRADGSVEIKEGKLIKLSGEEVLDGLVVDAGF